MMEGKKGLRIEIKGKRVKIILLDDSNEIDFEGWEDVGSLSQTLLANIEKVLLRNNLEIRDIASGVQVDSDNESYTSARIAKATSDMINFSLKQS